MKKPQTKEELKAYTDASKLKKKTQMVNRKYSYLKITEESMLLYTFLRAQAEEICDHLFVLKVGPFSGLYQQYRKMVTEEIFKDNFYIITNEYDEPFPDYERLSSQLPSKIIIT